MNWNKLSLFKLPNRHRRFDYMPRYYDPKKELLENKIKQAQLSKGEGVEGQVAREIRFKSEMQDKWGNSDYKAQSLRSNIRLILILGIVILIFYYIFVGLDGLGYFLDNNLENLK